MNIILFGHVCIDYNTIEGASYKSWGSSLLYIAKYLKEETTDQPVLLAPYGKDLNVVTNQSISNQPTDDSTLVYENIVESGVRRQKVQRYENVSEVQLSDRNIEQLSQADLFIFAPLLPSFSGDYVRQITESLPQTALKVILPQGYFRQVGKDRNITRRDFSEAAEITPLFDMMILSDEDVDAPINHIAMWHSFNKNLKIIVTENCAGATVYTHENELHIPTTPIGADDIINPIGTGDVFSIACSYQFARTENLALAVRSGHEAAAKSLKSPQPKAQETVGAYE